MPIRSPCFSRSFSRHLHGRGFLCRTGIRHERRRRCRRPGDRLQPVVVPLAAGPILPTGNAHELGQPRLAAIPDPTRHHRFPWHWLSQLHQRGNAFSVSSASCRGSAVLTAARPARCIVNMRTKASSPNRSRHTNDLALGKISHRIKMEPAHAGCYADHRIDGSTQKFGGTCFASESAPP